MKNLLICIASIVCMAGGFVTGHAFWGVLSIACLLYWFFEFTNPDSVTSKSFDELSQGSKTDFQKKVASKVKPSKRR